MPRLATGRLVETPAEITKSIRTFIEEDGILDLRTFENKVLVTGYDFLVDSGKKILQRWQEALGSTNNIAVNGELLDDDWSEEDLHASLSGLGEEFRRSDTCLKRDWP